MTETQTLEAASGDTLQVLFTVTDRAGDVVDLTGFTAKFVIAQDDGTAIIASPATATITWPDRAAGQVKVEVTADATEDLVGTYQWELQLTRGDGVKQRSAFGFVNLAENLIAA